MRTSKHLRSPSRNRSRKDEGIALTDKDLPVQYVVFRLGKEEYAFDISVVKEIHELQEIAKVHKSPAYIEGVMNLRGKLVTVIDLRKRLGLDAKAPDGLSKIVVVDASAAPVGC